MAVTPNSTSQFYTTTNNFAFLTAIGGFLNTLSFLIVVVEIASIYVLHKCVLMKSQIKYISQNLLLADMAFHVMQISMTVINKVFQMSVTSVFNSKLRIGAMYVLVMVYCILMCVAALDRFIAIRYPLHYEMMFPLSTVKKIVRVIWFVTICVLLVPFVLGISLYCNLMSCGDAGQPLLFNQYFRMILAVLFIICDIGVVTLYAFVIIQSGKQQRKMRRMINGTRANVQMRLPGRRIMMIVGTFIVLYSPAVINTVLFDLVQFKASLVLVDIVYLIGFRIFMSMHSCISLYLYTYGMPECRMRFTTIFLSWSKKYRQESNRMKFLLFNIPVVEKVTEESKIEKY